MCRVLHQPRIACLYAPVSGKKLATEGKGEFFYVLIYILISLNDVFLVKQIHFKGGRSIVGNL